MDSNDIDRIKHVTNIEVLRRLLIKYFIDKGFGHSFDIHVYPAILQDMPVVMPALYNKLEVVPYADNIDLSTGRATLGWNLFVLGNNRMFLGKTYHNNLSDLARQIRSGAIKQPENAGSLAQHQTTPRRIVAFITRVLNGHSEGYLDFNKPTQPVRPHGDALKAKNTMMGMPSQYFSRSGYGV